MRQAGAEDFLNKTDPAADLVAAIRRRPGKTGLPP